MEMDTGKAYHDSDGNECSIWQMVRREPEWAANRIQEGEKAIEHHSRLIERLEEEIMQAIAAEPELPTYLSVWQGSPVKFADKRHTEGAAGHGGSRISTLPVRTLMLGNGRFHDNIRHSRGGVR
jgi:hypothetical protein